MLTLTAISDRRPSEIPCYGNIAGIVKGDTEVGGSHGVDREIIACLQVLRRNTYAWQISIYAKIGRAHV